MYSAIVIHCVTPSTRSAVDPIRQAYKILELPCNATETQVKSAFRRLAKIYHPDHGNITNRFQEIYAAYTILVESFSQKRKRRGRPPKYAKVDRGYAIVDQDNKIIWDNFASRKEANAILNKLPKGMADSKGKSKLLRVVGNAVAERQRAKRQRDIHFRRKVIGLIVGKDIETIPHNQRTGIKKTELKDFNKEERKKLSTTDDEGNVIGNPSAMSQGAYFRGPEVPHGLAKIHSGGIDSKKIEDIDAAHQIAEGYYFEQGEGCVGVKAGRPEGNGPDAFDRSEDQFDPLDSPERYSSSEWDERNELEFQNSPVLRGGFDALSGVSVEDRELPRFEGWDQTPIEDAAFGTRAEDGDEDKPREIESEILQGCGVVGRETWAHDNGGLPDKSFTELVAEIVPDEPVSPAWLEYNKAQMTGSESLGQLHWYREDFDTLVSSTGAKVIFREGGRLGIDAAIRAFLKGFRASLIGKSVAPELKTSKAKRKRHEIDKGEEVEMPPKVLTVKGI